MSEKQSKHGQQEKESTILQVLDFLDIMLKNPIFNRLKEIKRNLDEYGIRYARNDETVLRNKRNFLEMKQTR